MECQIKKAAGRWSGIEVGKLLLLLILLLVHLEDINICHLSLHRKIIAEYELVIANMMSKLLIFIPCTVAL